MRRFLGLDKPKSERPPEELAEALGIYAMQRCGVSLSADEYVDLPALVADDLRLVHEVYRGN